jgi:excisionase family DNA binding protein
MSTALFYRRADAARILDCDPRTVDRGIADGLIPAVRIGSLVRIPVHAFHEAMGIPLAQPEQEPQPSGPAQPPPLRAIDGGGATAA